MNITSDEYLKLYDRVSNLRDSSRERADEASEIGDRVNAQHHSGQSYAYGVIVAMLHTLYDKHSQREREGKA